MDRSEEGIATRAPSRPAASTTCIAVAWVAAARSRSTMPMPSATGMAGPRMSTGLPLERRSCDRSTTVGWNPCWASR